MCMQKRSDSNQVNFAREARVLTLKCGEAGGAWWGRSKQEERERYVEKRGAGMLAFSSVYSTRVREAVGRGGMW